MKRISLIFVAFLLCIGHSLADGKCYYVSPNGNDRNSGTIEAPFKTLQKAFDTVEVGETIAIRGGSYNERGILRTSGTQQQPITIQAYANENPVLDGTGLIGNGNSDWGLLVLESVKNVVVDGLSFVNSMGCGLYARGAGNEAITVKNCIARNCLSSAISFGADYNASSHITVTGNRVDNCSQQFREAISLRTVDHFEISHNEVSNVIKESIDAKSGCTNGDIFGNIVINGGHVGIYIDAGFANTPVSRNIRIYNNKLVNPQVTAIAIASEEGNEGCDIHVFNNLIYDFNKAQGAGIKVAKNSDSGNDGYLHDIYIYNNTVVGRAQQGLYVNLGGVRNIVFRNNISMHNASQMALNTANGVDPNEITIENNLYYGPVQTPGQQAVTVADINAVFVDLTVADFHLKKGSPAIDKGTATSAPTTDLDGLSRPQGAGIDIGCYEFHDTPTHIGATLSQPSQVTQVYGLDGTRRQSPERGVNVIKRKKMLRK